VLIGSRGGGGYGGGLGKSKAAQERQNSPASRGTFHRIRPRAILVLPAPRLEARDGIEKEGTAALSAWKLEFGGAALGVGAGVTYDGFRGLFHGRAANPTATPPVTAMPSLREPKEAYSDQATLDRRETGRLNAPLGTIQRDCQDWYAEATKVFVAGSEIGTSSAPRSRPPRTTARPHPTRRRPLPPARRLTATAVLRFESYR
jgi:hypothetical protein